MHAPKKIKPQSLSDYLEVMSKAVFQTGISWKVVESKWLGIKEAFHGFDPNVLSKMTMAEIEILSKDSRIIRNFRKVDAIVGNARRMLELDKSYGTFTKYLRSFNSYDELTKDLHKQFKFLGDMGCYYFLWVVGEKVPSYEEWSSKYEAKHS
ncbi:MAG: DNA-3-methyladenine glycosylase I [Dehalococcoidia bacterium]|jgi:3-methyladenine DNA glycosylase Tag